MSSKTDVAKKAYNYCVLCDIVSTAIQLLPVATKTTPVQRNSLITKSLVETLESKRPVA